MGDKRKSTKSLKKCELSDPSKIVNALAAMFSDIYLTEAELSLWDSYNPSFPFYFSTISEDDV